MDIQSRTSEPEHDPSSFTKLFRRCLRHVFTHPLPTSDPGPPPDGGLLAWSQVLAGHLICSVTWGNVTSFGVFQTYYVETLGRTASDVSWIGGIQIFLLLAIGTFSGRATDAGLAHWVVLLGSTVLVFGTLMTSFATEYWQIFLSQGVCVGLGMGIVYMPGLAMISTYFSKKKSLASSIFASGAGTGGLIFPAIVQQLLPRVGESMPQCVIKQVMLILFLRVWMDSSMCGSCYVDHLHHLQPIAPSTTTTSKSRSSCRLAGFPRATVCAIHCRLLPHLLGDLFRLLLRT